MEKTTKYTLVNVATGREFEDSGWLLEDKESNENTLVRTKYAKKQISVGDMEMGIYRFADWLPINHTLKGSAAPVTYKSKALAEHLGLKNLYITFSGYYPEIGAAMKTCSFKETEAYSVCGRLPKGEKRSLVVASAGNTARAFAKVCSQNNISLILCVPEDNKNALWFDEPINDCVKLYTTEKGSDYFDAINLSNIIAEDEAFLPEGGAKNVARRDGMATTMLSATNFIGEIPQYYFQAIGSGTGAIAAWEANIRLLEDGRFGNRKTKMILSQNAPFLPMYNAWKAASRAMLHYDDDQARKDVEIIDAKVLSNRKPPYPIIGGVFDALCDCKGDIVAIQNESAAKAGRLFEKLEGIDIHPAAAVAVESLIKSVEKGDVEKDAIIMINITGGGEKRFMSEKKVSYLKPNYVFKKDATKEEILKIVKGC
ncbi:MAG: cysteate synthase [Rikenellaceae bacterium]